MLNGRRDASALITAKLIAEHARAGSRGVFVPVMLSLWKLRVGVENYYIGQVANGLDDYYTGHGEMPGRWLGAASSGLGLGLEPVTGDELQAVLAGLAPGTGLTPNGDQLRPWKYRVPGFDLTFSAPKSVSVLYALADPLVRSQVIEATDRAVDEALAWLEREACFVRRGSNNRATAPGDSATFGTRRLPGAGFVAAAFRHRTSRAGDPHLHTHVLVANITRGPDRRWTALDAHGLYRSKLAAGAVYQTVLRDELSRRLGVEWRPIHNHTADIAGIPHKVLKLFSKRREEIEDELERLGVEGPAAAAEAMLATRTTKTLLDGETLYDHWQAEALAAGFGPDQVDTLLTNAPTFDPDATVTPATTPGVAGDQPETAAAFTGRVTDTLIGHDSTFTRHQITTAIAEQLPAGSTSAALERLTNWVLAQPDLVPLPHDPDADTGWEQRWTSRRLLAIEAELLTALTPQPGTTAVVDQQLVEGIVEGVGTLGDDQADTVRRVTTQGLGVEVVVGRAGTGKTYTMNTVRAVFQAAGYTTIGLATTARAARELSDGAGIEAYTIARLRRHNLRLGPRHVVIIDEAGMTGTVDLHWAITRACDAGAKVILVGDHHQLPEITAGGGFAAAVATLAGYTAELTVNRRQHAEWEQTALDQLRNGEARKAFAHYMDHQRVTLHDDPSTVHAAAVNDWLTAHRDGRHALLLAGTRAEARALNKAARHTTADLLHGPTLDVRDRQFQAGDRILLLHNQAGQLDLDTGKRCRVDNGMIGTITRINTFTDRQEADSIDIELDNGRRLRLSRDYVLAGNIDHGYAATIHKAQGITCDLVHLVGPAGLYQEAAYVALSRARLGAWIYATTHQALSLAEPGHSNKAIPLPSEPDPDPELDLIDALQTSKAKQLATLQAAHLAAVGDLADTTPLDVLVTRHRHIRDTIHELTRSGYTDPTLPADRLHRSRDHRQFMHVGNRVKALDWDNVGTICAIFDRTGTALVEFTTSDRHDHAVKTLDWADLKPIDQPEPAELTPDAIDYLTLAATAVQETRWEWKQQLAFHRIHPDDTTIIPAAIQTRRRRLAHALAADPPDWLTWWLGNRPTDPSGTQVWDDELAELAAWRDDHHLADTTPGYGPQPDDPQHAHQWRQHLDRSLTTRAWLTNHQPQLDNDAPAPIDVIALRQRLAELDAILHTAPPDQRRIIDAIHNGELTPNDINIALTQAARTQTARRDWILEHWPHVIEHAELTRLDSTHDPLAHWPTALTPAEQDLYQQLTATSSDTPEPRTIPELEAELDAADPRRRLDDTTRQLDHVRDTIHQLRKARQSGNPARATLIDSHLQRLAEQRTELERTQRRHQAETSLWDLGHRPSELVDAHNRRANHLAHTAITAHEPWIHATIRQWTDQHPDTSIQGLRRLINDIAAWREHTGHTGPDPIGPQPSNHTRIVEWSQLHAQLSEPTDMHTTHSLAR